MILKTRPHDDYFEDEDGDRYWKRDGKFHREDGPAIHRKNGYQAWFINGKRHRVGGPAVTSASGSEYWYQHGRRHREDGPAFINSSSILWYIRDEHITSRKRYKKLTGISNADLSFLMLKYGGLN